MCVCYVGTLFRNLSIYFVCLYYTSLSLCSSIMKFKWHTMDSQEVSHPSTDQAQACLPSVKGLLQVPSDHTFGSNMDSDATFHIS